MTRRQLVTSLACAGAPALAAQGGPEIAAGPFAPTRESLKGYRVPAWFRDVR
ncbi:MAG: hypothetical protein AAB225_32210 [Acidobacteriota bacterium]